jgi:N-hydroxyarylamine O-acetyltransferase
MNLDAYLERIEYAGPLTATRGVLDALHLAHATHIHFENLDILLGRPIALDLEQLEQKLVAGGRGGYCFEQNTLFAEVLRRVGFAVTPLAARVRFRARDVLPRTHMLLLVDVEGERRIADVGFGADGLFRSLPLVPEVETSQFAWTYRLVEEGDGYVLQSLRERQWTDLYVFTLEPQYPVDFEMANHYTSTYPGSRFVQMLVVQKMTPEARTFLLNRKLFVDTGTNVDVRLLAETEIPQTLGETFNLYLPPDTRFRLPEGVI